MLGTRTTTLGACLGLAALHLACGGGSPSSSSSGAQGDFSVQALQPGVALAAGSSASLALSLQAPGGFPGGVSVQLTDAPAGLSASYAASGDSSTGVLTLSAAASAPVGNAIAAARVTAGPFSHAVRFLVSLRPGAAGPGDSVTLRTTADGQPSAAVFLAYQDGHGPWQALSGASGSCTFRVSDPAGLYGVAVVQSFAPGSSQPNFVVMHSTLAEDTHLEVLMPRQGTEAVVYGQVAGLDASHDASIGFGDGAPGGATQAVPFFSVQSTVGMGDLLLASMSQGASPADYTSDRILIRRDLQLTAGGLALGTLDLAAEGRAMEAHDIQLLGLGAGEQVSWDLGFGTQYSYLDLQSVSAGSAVFPSAQVPSALLQDGDLHQLSASPANHAGLVAYFHAPRPWQIEAPAMPSNPGLTGSIAAKGPYLRPSFSWSRSAASQNTVLRISGGSGPSWLVSMSPGWIGTSGQYTTPDLSGVVGWDASWNVAGVTGDPVDGRLGETWGNVPALAPQQHFSGPALDGAIYSGAGAEIHFPVN